MLRIAVVGGGISGLTAAYLLNSEARRRALPLEVKLLERSGRLGGVIRTEHVDGCLLEWGPENFVPLKPRILDLIRLLGLDDQLLGSNDDHRRTYVYSEAGLEPLPDGLAFLTPVNPVAFFKTSLLSTPGKLRALLEPLVPRGRGEPSIRDFLSRRLGSEFTQRIAEPLISAIYAGDIDRLGARAALASTYSLEQKYGSLWRGMRRAGNSKRGRGSMFYSFRQGMSELVKALQAALPPVAVHLNLKDLTLEARDGIYRLAGSGYEGEFDELVIATPAPAAARLLEPLLPGVSAGLNRIPYSSTNLIYLGYRRDQFSHPLDGFGFVAQRGVAQKLDACTWVSTKFDGRCPEDRVLLRAAVHDGRWERSRSSDEELVESVHQELRRLLHIDCRPDFWRVRPVPKGMPQPGLDHLQLLRDIRGSLKGLPGLQLCGGYAGGVGLPDCVANSAALVEGLLERRFPASGGCRQRAFA